MTEWCNCQNYWSIWLIIPYTIFNSITIGVYITLPCRSPYTIYSEVFAFILLKYFHNDQQANWKNNFCFTNPTKINILSRNYFVFSYSNYFLIYISLSVFYVFINLSQWIYFRFFLLLSLLYRFSWPMYYATDFTLTLKRLHILWEK